MSNGNAIRLDQGTVRTSTMAVTVAILIQGDGSGCVTLFVRDPKNGRKVELGAFSGDEWQQFAAIVERTNAEIERLKNEGQLVRIGEVTLG